MADGKKRKIGKTGGSNVVDGTPPRTESVVNGMLRTQRQINAATKESFSAESLKQLSELRRGEFNTLGKGSASTTKNGAEPVVVGVGVKKQANFGAGNNYPSFGGRGGGVDHMMPELYSPLFQVANLNLPRDRMTMNAWNRTFFDTHPIVRNAITLHATYPISKINVKCKHRKVEQFFNDMAAKIDLFEAIQEVAFEYWKIGEAFPYAELDETAGIWGSIVVQNPDYITVKKSSVSNVPVISLRPDETLKKIISSNHPADVKIRASIPDNIIHHIRRNESIPLDNFNVAHLKMRSSPYDLRGTSLIVSCYKNLMLQDKLFECKLAQADSLVNPITLISVGGSGEGEYHPSPGDLEEYRQMLEAAQNNRDFKIVTHAAMKIERIGANSAIIDTQNDLNFIRENLYAGLMVPKAIMDTEGTAYASASVGLEVLRTRYINFRNMLEKWLEKKIFAPISQIQGFFEYKNGEKVLIVPEVDWNHINLYDLNDYIQALGGYVEKKQISVHTLYRSLGLNFEEENRLIREESVRSAIMAKEAAEFQKMSLVELRALDPDEQIVESTDSNAALPGQVPGSPEAGGDMPDMGAPGAMPMPDMSMPLSPAPSEVPGAEAPPPPTPAAEPPKV